MDMPSPTQPEKAPEIRGLDETARFFKVTAPTVRAWIKDPDDPCPVVKMGGNGVPYELDLRAVAAWKRARDERRQALSEEQAARDAQLAMDLLGDDMLPDGDGADAGPMSARQRADYLRAEMDKVKLAEKRGELVRAADVRAVLSEAFAVLREQLRSLPDTLALDHGWDDAVAESVLASVDDALNDLADNLSQLETKETPGDAQAA